MPYRAPASEYPFLRAAGLILAIISIGTVGYEVIEGWPFLDALFMTITSVTTVGYGEVHPLGPQGKIFTCLLIFAGVSAAAYAFSTIVRLVVEGEIYRMRGVRKMRAQIEQLNHHTIVCGYGLLGKIVVRELLNSGQDIVVIDEDPLKITELEQNGISFVQGSAYDDEVLQRAGVKRAKSLISLLPRDADTIYVTLCARDLNPELTIVARTEDEAGEKRLRRAGATQVFTPYRFAGSRLVQQLVKPKVSHFLEIAVNPTAAPLAMEEVVVPLDSQLAGQTLESSALRKKTGVVVAAFIEPNGNMLFNPGPDNVIMPGATMIVLGERNSLIKLGELLQETA